ncbi:MAG TPA: alpha/beta hydrolase [Trinickia sp.]
MKEIIHFSHANGFPASIYRTLFAELSDDYELRYIERIGHDPHYPVTSDWPHLVEELLADIGRRYERPVWLVGHSMGGYVSLMAALKHPHWVRGVVMLDSPVVAGWRASVLRFTQWTGLDERLSPAAATRKRRKQWASRDEAWRHFHAKPAFARWDERVLSDYIEFGIPPDSALGTRSLAFDRDIEYRIYRTLPRTLGARLARGAPVPVGFVAGTHSKEIRQVGLEATMRAAQGRIEWIEGSHLFPMERPIETARVLLGMLNKLRETG